MGELPLTASKLLEKLEARPSELRAQGRWKDFTGDFSPCSWEGGKQLRTNKYRNAGQKQLSFFSRAFPALPFESKGLQE